MIDEFNNGLRLSHGRKYIKVIQNGSVWGFIAVTDGVLKGIPYKFGDVFKAAGWRAPAKHVRTVAWLCVGASHLCLWAQNRIVNFSPPATQTSVSAHVTCI